MPFQPGQSGNPGGRSKDRPFRDALRMELAAVENGQGDEYVVPRSLRAIARALLERAMINDLAVREVADRLDGKVPQGIIGGTPGEDEPLAFTWLTGVVNVDGS